MRIIDANLLIFAFREASERHAEAKSWLERVYATDDVVGIPALVLLAFVRITTNPRIMSPPARLETAFGQVEELLNHPKTLVVEPGPSHWKVLRKVALQAGVRGPAMTDAFLATLAIEHGATLCSQDEGFRRYKDLRFENPLPGV